ncbi:MAG TPA: dethiobiotin synthase [Acidimicrobiales bacterium]|nr:dethiobiotin synthase [Acidimicrobiales bacterium]
MQATRPERLVLVVGSGTEVGKTWVTCRLARALRRRGLIVVARKPAQSYDVGDDLSDTDAALLAHATGDHPAAVCPQHRWYPVAMAPPMAAEALGRRPFTIADLVDELAWPAVVGVGLVEAAGGVRSPLAADGDAAALAGALRPDRVVLVADAGLGTINGVRLSMAALAPWPVTVVLNRFDPADDLHVRNLEWLGGVDGFDVVTDAEDLVSPIVGWPS